MARAERKKSQPVSDPGTARARRSASAPGPRAVAREARESLYREHILRAAEKVFAEQGFEAAKLQDISHLAGLSMGSIYALFPGKEQLFASIIETRGNEILELARSVLASHAAPLGALEALATAYIDYFYDHRDFLRMHIRTGASWALEPHYPGARATLTRAFHEMQRDLFARGIEAGVFADEDPSYLAALFTGIDQTVLAHWVANGMQGSRDELRERFLRVTRKVFVR